MISKYLPVTPSTFVTPLLAGNFEFVSAHTIFPYRNNGAGDENIYTQDVYDQNGNSLFHNVYEDNYSYHDIKGQDIGVTLTLVSGQTYKVVYNYYSEDITATSGFHCNVTATYTFLAVENQYPLKKWTMKDVINRVLDLAEPIRKGEEPRFKLNTDQAALFDKILAPQFSFTKPTLRECLQQCGKIVHGEPRLDIAQDSTGKYYYEVSFDLYGQTAKSGVYARKYIQQTVSQVIDSYASHLDSNAENLVNALDKYTGVIVEPYAGGYKTVRTDSMYVRITDENMIIPTQFPIYSIEKVECGYIPENGDKGSPPIDITAWVFESSVYNSQLSSYSEQYPYSKAFGISYTQGQKNLTALNFKQENPIASVFENYAIINILRKAANDDSIDISKDYPLLAFRVTYTPFYNSRVGQTKVNYQDYPYGAALIYNQAANVIESRYYGENLKGAIARIGNVEKSVTYIMGRLGHVPRAGQMYDDDYYISAVSVEFMPTYIKCTIGLSKDFNRLSQYIGISSAKRYSEVSQTQSVERNLLYKEYVVIGDSIEADSDCHMGDNLMGAIAQSFTQGGTYLPLTNVAAWGESFGGDDLPCVYLPLIASAFGNSIAFSWEYEDNYSAGAISQYAENGNVKGYFQNNYQYTDYYGKIYYYNFDLQREGPQPSNSYTPEDISSSVNYSIASDGRSVTFTFSNPNGYSVTIGARVVEQFTNGSTQTLSRSFTTTGTSYTLTAQLGNTTITSVTVTSAVMQVPNFIGSQTEIGTSLPEGEIPDVQSNYFSTGTTPYILRKDNREKLQGNVQIDFVTNRKGLIIGSALTSYCGAVRTPNSALAAKLYVFDEPVNKFIDHVEGWTDIDLSGITPQDISVSSVSNGRFSVSAGNFAASGKAWAIVTNQTEETETVEDEEGNITPQTVQNGGDVLIAQNMDVSAGQAFPTVYFTKKRKIFKEDVWTAIR